MEEDVTYDEQLKRAQRTVIFSAFKLLPELNAVRPSEDGMVLTFDVENDFPKTRLQRVHDRLKTILDDIDFSVSGGSDAPPEVNVKFHFNF
jgi:hypothetical protein